MAKNAYVGNGVARQAKKIYVGVEPDTPTYVTTSKTVNVTADNIWSVFTVANDLYHFAGSGSTFTSNNAGKKNTIAATVLTAKTDMTVSFMYSYSTEQPYDKFSLYVAGQAIEDGVSGATTTKFYEGSLTEGQSIVFEYAKDTSNDSNDDQCTFSNMVVVSTIKTQTAIARKVKKGYVGDENGIARLFFTDGIDISAATATPVDVLKGYTFYGAGSEELQTGTNVDLRVVRGTYKTTSSSYINFTINCGWKPKYVFIYGDAASGTSYQGKTMYMVYSESYTDKWVHNTGNGYDYGKVTLSSTGFTYNSQITWYDTSTITYVAIG